QGGDRGLTDEQRGLEIDRQLPIDGFGGELEEVAERGEPARDVDHRVEAAELPLRQGHRGAGGVRRGQVPRRRERGDALPGELAYPVAEDVAAPIGEDESRAGGAEGPRDRVADLADAADARDEGDFPGELSHRGSCPWQRRPRTATGLPAAHSESCRPVPPGTPTAGSPRRHPSPRDTPWRSPAPDRTAAGN